MTLLSCLSRDIHECCAHTFATFFSLEMKKSAIVEKFRELTQRDDVGILLINQNVRYQCIWCSLTPAQAHSKSHVRSQKISAKSWISMIRCTRPFSKSPAKTTRSLHILLVLFKNVRWMVILFSCCCRLRYVAEKDYIMRRVMHMLGK